MSEPFSLVVFAPADLHNLQSTLRADLGPISTFSDWGTLDAALQPADFARADAITPSNAKRYLQDLRQSARQDRGWHFSHDPQTGYLTIICLLWTQSWPEIVSGLNILRQMLASCTDGRQGYILVHDFVFEQKGTAAAVQFQHATSHLFGSGDAGNIAAIEHAAQLVTPMLETAHAVFGGQLSPDSFEAQMVDQFEQLAAG